MEHFEITKTASGFHIEGFPDAVKVLRIAGKKVRRLADLALHKVDLDFTLECLETINTTQDEAHTVRRALWHSAIVNFIKCFGQSKSRFNLDPKIVYKAHPGAFEPYHYFDSLRNGNLVHDENSYMQCLPGAVLNKKGTDHNIAKIVCLSVVGETLGKENYQNLHLLATHARDWVVARFDELCDEITRELEPRPYEELLAMKGITYTAPGADDVHKPRAAL